MTKFEALEAAKLAKSIGSQLGAIDKLMVDPRSSANQINLNKFISQVVNPNGVSHNQSAQTPVNSPYLPEDLVQRIVPDTSSASNAPIEQIIHEQVNQKQMKPMKNKQETSVGISIDDKTFKKIALSLDRIAKSYEKYVNYVVDVKTTMSVLNE